MTYWIFVTDHMNWDVVLKEGIYGLPEKREKLMKRVKKGDEAFIYMVQEKVEYRILPSRIAGLFEIVSDPFKSDKRIFRGDLYPNRVMLKPILVPERPLDFKPLVPRLSFIRNKERWSAYLRRGIVEIPEKDYMLIRREMESTSGKST
ncbi:MAG: EVE domain-containing protein [Thermoproteota archaeon]|nr:MAG: EVE domain-containing protein [Candidatus Korarchaeota archaeon]